MTQDLDVLSQGNHSMWRNLCPEGSHLQCAKTSA